VFAETGLDLDDRLTQFDMYGRAMEESIVQYRNFVRLVPGFKTVSTDDASVLMKGSVSFRFATSARHYGADDVKNLNIANVARNTSRFGLCLKLLLLF
jgi:hypothetical protein